MYHKKKIHNSIGTFLIFFPKVAETFFSNRSLKMGRQIYLSNEVNYTYLKGSKKWCFAKTVIFCYPGPNQTMIQLLQMEFLE